MVILLRMVNQSSIENSEFVIISVSKIYTRTVCCCDYITSDIQRLKKIISITSIKDNNLS